MGYIYNFSIQLLCILIIWLQINKKQELYQESYRPVGRLLYVFFILVFAYSMYTGFGGDNRRYQEFVEGGYQYYYIFDSFSFEKLYVIIAEYTQNFILWKIIVYGSAIVLSIWSIKRLGADNLITLCFFALIPMSSYGSTRAVLAYSILLFGYTFLYKKKIFNKILGLLIVFLSWKAHSSMILPIVLTPLTFFKITKTRLYILLVLFPIFVLLFNHYYGVFLGTSFMEGSMSAEKFDSYTIGEYQTQVSTVGGILRFLFGFVILPPILVGINAVSSDTINEKFNKVIKLSFLLAYASFVIYFSELDNITFFNRYFTMIPFFLYIVMSSIISKLSPSIRKTYLYFVLFYTMLDLSYNLYCAILI